MSAQRIEELRKILETKPTHAIFSATKDYKGETRVVYDVFPKRNARELASLGWTIFSQPEAPASAKKTALKAKKAKSNDGGEIKSQ